MFLCIIKVFYYGSVVTRLIIPVQCMTVVKNLFFECTKNQGEWEKVHPNLSASTLSNYYRCAQTQLQVASSLQCFYKQFCYYLTLTWYADHS